MLHIIWITFWVWLTWHLLAPAALIIIAVGLVFGVIYGAAYGSVLWQKLRRRI